MIEEKYSLVLSSSHLKSYKKKKMFLAEVKLN